MFALYRQLAWFFRVHWRDYALALALLMFVAMLNLSVPWITGRTVDAIAAKTLDREGLWQVAALLGMIGIATYGLRYYWRTLLYGASYRLGTVLRERYYRRLLSLGPAFYEQHNTGDLMARATNDIDAVEMAAGEGVLSGFDGGTILVMVLVMMFVVIDWRLATVALLPFPVMIIGFRHISERMHRQFDVSLQKFSDLNDRTQEALAGIRLVKSMGREDIEMAAFNRVAREAADANFRVQRTEAWYDPFIFLVLAVSLLLTLAGGAWLIERNELTLGELTSFTMYLGQLVWPMFALGWLMNIVQRGRAALTRVNEFLAEPDTLPDMGTQSIPAQPILQLSLQRFCYPGHDEAALGAIELSLPPGITVGIVGPTGSGKSTLLQVLMRHYDTPQGEVALNDVPVTAFPLAALRQIFAYVPQDPFLFSASLAENIALGKPDACGKSSPGLAEIERVSALAALEDDVKRLPQGYETPVGERGIALSGGQRQRVALARALLLDRPVLVLDDALSAVDVQTEKSILAHLRSQRAGRTCLVASHRLSAVAEADIILVMSHGVVRERGTHAELLALGGWYARMWAYQQLEAQLNVD